MLAGTVCTLLTIPDHCEASLRGRSMASSFRSKSFPRIALVIALGSFGIISPSAFAADFVVNPNEDLLVKLPPRVATIVVGNPLFVDVHMAARGIMVLTAKSYGETNIIFLDRAGTVLMQPSVLVRRQNNNDDQVVYRGLKSDDNAPAEATAPNALILHFNGGKRVDLPVGN